MTTFFNSRPAEKANLLLVDEDRFVANILKQTLSADFNVKVVSNGIEAMHWLEQGTTPELMITELGMAHLNGHELIRLVRGSSLFNQLPIMVLSERDDSGTRIECLESGADGYVVKPFNPLEVKAKVRAILRRAQAQPQSNVVMA